MFSHWIFPLGSSGHLVIIVDLPGLVEMTRPVFSKICISTSIGAIVVLGGMLSITTGSFQDVSADGGNPSPEDTIFMRLSICRCCSSMPLLLFNAAAAAQTPVSWATLRAQTAPPRSIDAGRSTPLLLLIGFVGGQKVISTPVSSAAATLVPSTTSGARSPRAGAPCCCCPRPILCRRRRRRPPPALPPTPS